MNLATELLIDACARDFDQAWIISNDSDLAWPIARVRSLFKREVGVFKPDRPPAYPAARYRKDSYELKKVANWFHRIQEWQLSAAQFAPTLTDAHGTITKPPGW